MMSLDTVYPADVGCLCDKASVVGDKIKGTLCISGGGQDKGDTVSVVGDKIKGTLYQWWGTR